jgi:PPM family protein phosphatase
MSLLEIVCASCGEVTEDSSWCDHCGAPIDVAEPAPESWLEVGEEVVIHVSASAFQAGAEGRLALVLRIEELVEQFVNRRVFIGAVVGGEGQEDLVALASQTAYILEESAGSRLALADRVPESLRHRMREAIFSGQRGEHGLRVYLDNAGITLEELVVLARGQLTLSQVKDVFLTVLDSIIELHEARHAHLRLAPWTVRVLDVHSADGFPGHLLQQALGPRTTGRDQPAPERTGKSQGDGSGFDERLNTLVQLVPLEDALEAIDVDDGVSVVADFDVTAFDTALEVTDGDCLSEASVFESEPMWESEGDASKDAGSEADVLPHVLSVIFDGIDEFYCLEEDIEVSSVVVGFSPPEMLGRLRAPIGEGSDIFSLGMLLYYLICGQSPPASVYTRYAPALPVRNLRPSFPPGLQGVISRATRPSPQDRYADVAAMRQAFVEACDVMAMRSMIADRAVPAMRLASDTHVGIAKKRRNPINQDSVYSAISDDGKLCLIVVADGVSTASFGSGDLASDALTRAAVRAWEDLLPSYLMDEAFDEVAVIQSLLAEANQTIVDYVNAHCTPFRGSPHEVMGSTAVVAIINKGVVTLATLGDSRAYLQRGRTLEQLTIDHNLWTLSIIDGVSADNALAMAHGDALARCLGTFLIDQGNLVAVAPQPDLFRFIVTAGDSLLLTTDGLVDFGGPNPLIAEDNMLSILLAEPDPALCCLELILLANRGGGGDNIGLSVVKFP